MILAFQILGGIMIIFALIGIVAKQLEKSQTETLTELDRREKANHNLGQKCTLHTCSQPVPISHAESYRRVHGKPYPYEYSLKF